MDTLYRGLETSLLGLGLILCIAAAVLPRLPDAMLLAQAEVTLPMIEVSASEAR